MTYTHNTDIREVTARLSMSKVSEGFYAAPKGHTVQLRPWLQ